MNYFVIIGISVLLIFVFFFLGIKVGIRMGWQQAIDSEKHSGFEFDASDERSEW